MQSGRSCRQPGHPASREVGVYSAMSVEYKYRHLAQHVVDAVLTTPSLSHAVRIALPREEESEVPAALTDWRNQERARLSAAGIGPGDVGPILNIGKSWDALQRLLGASPAEDLAAPSVEAKRGGHIVEDRGDVARLLSLDQVRTANGALAGLPVDVLASRFNGKELDRLGTYYGPWSEPGAFEELAAVYTRVREYFSEAASQNRGMFIFWP